MEPSAKAFKALVWPTIAPEIGGGELVPVESVTADDFKAMLDMIAGIDAWVVQQDRHIFGLASRVQAMRPEWNNGLPWNTFTIRTQRPSGEPTEYQKREEQISTAGSLYPRWTCQAYTNAEMTGLLTAAVALTQDVIAAVRLGKGYDQRAYSGEKFRVIPWGDLWKAGCRSLVVITREGVHRLPGAADEP